MSVPQSYYYHGTTIEIDGEYLLPKPSDVVDMENVVFAARTRWIAAVFSVPWDDTVVQFGTSDDQYILRECHSGAFDRFKRGATIHTISAASFDNDIRLGMYGDEFVSRRPVHVQSSEYVACIYTYLRTIPELKMLGSHIPSPWK